VVGNGTLPTADASPKPVPAETPQTVSSILKPLSTCFPWLQLKFQLSRSANSEGSSASTIIELGMLAATSNAPQTPVEQSSAPQSTAPSNESSSGWVSGAPKRSESAVNLGVARVSGIAAATAAAADVSVIFNSKPSEEISLPPQI
jgi:hypothetical protein